MAAEGMRVLGVAEAEHTSGATAGSRRATSIFDYLGLVGLADPLRSTVPDAVARMPQRGHPRGDDHRRLSRRPRAPSRPSRARPAKPVLTGAEIDALDDAGLREAVGRSRRFARIMPEQKLRHRSSAQGAAARWSR